MRRYQYGISLECQLKYYDNKQVSLESKYEKLSRLQDRIQRLGKLDRYVSLEGIELLPNSRFNSYKTALEDISGGMWAIIIAGAAALVAMLTKFISWIIGDGGGSGGGGGGSSSIATVAKISDNNQAHEKIIKQLDNVMDFDKTIELYISGKIGTGGKESNLASLVNNDNPLIQDILHGLRYASVMYSVEYNFSEICSGFEKFYEFFKDKFNDVKVESNRNDLITEVDKMFEVDDFLDKNKYDILKDHKKYKISELVEKIKEIKANSIANVKYPTINLRKEANAFSDILNKTRAKEVLGKVSVFEKNATNILDLMETAIKDFKVYEIQTAGAISTLNDPNTKNNDGTPLDDDERKKGIIKIEETVTFAKALLTNVRAESAGYLSLFSQITSYYKLINAINDIYLDIENAILHEIINNNPSKLSDVDLKRVRDGYAELKIFTSMLKKNK